MLAAPRACASRQLSQKLCMHGSAFGVRAPGGSWYASLRSWWPMLVETRVALLAVLGTMQSGPLLLLLLAALSAADQCGGLG